MKKPLSDAFLRLSSQSSSVLKDLAKSIKYMSTSQDADLLIKDMGLALGELQIALKSYLNQGQQTVASLPLVEVMPLITLASHLIEISARIVAVVDSVNELADVVFYIKPSAKEKSSVVCTPLEFSKDNKEIECNKSENSLFHLFQKELRA